MTTDDIYHGLMSDPLCTGNKEHDDLVGLVAELADNVRSLEAQVARLESQVRSLSVGLDPLP